MWPRLWAGIPSVITPFFGDQPYWGRRVHALGVGPQPIMHRALTTQRLAQAITQIPAVLEDALKACRWLIVPGRPARPISFAGDSSGSGLAIATATALRDQGARPIDL
jgi:hypothetical protein